MVIEGASITVGLDAADLSSIQVITVYHQTAEVPGFDSSISHNEKNSVDRFKRLRVFMHNKLFNK